MDGPNLWRQGSSSHFFNSQDPFFLSSSLLCLSWEEQQHQHWRNTTRSKLMENVINSSASWPWSLTLAAPILPRKPDSVIAIRETLHPFVFYCNPSQAIDGLPYFFPTPILICSFLAKKRYTAYSQHLRMYCTALTGTKSAPINIISWTKKSQAWFPVHASRPILILAHILHNKTFGICCKFIFP